MAITGSEMRSMKIGMASTAAALANSSVTSSKWCLSTSGRIFPACSCSWGLPPRCRTFRLRISRESRPMVRPDIKPARQGRIKQFNPFTPKLKKYILSTFHRERYKWYYENLVVQSFSVKSYEKPKFFITVSCDITGEAAGEIWTWSISGVKGLIMGEWRGLEEWLVTLLHSSRGMMVIHNWTLIPYPCTKFTEYVLFCCYPYPHRQSLQDPLPLKIVLSRGRGVRGRWIISGMLHYILVWTYEANLITRPPQSLYDGWGNLIQSEWKL